MSNIVKGKIGNALESAAADGIVATADAIFDETKNKRQDQINEEVDQGLSAQYHNTGYYECDTAAATAAKTISTGSYSYQLPSTPPYGGSIKVKFTNKNSAANPTLSINLSDPKPLYYNGAIASSTNTWEDGDVLDLYYDGTNFNATSVVEKFATGEKVKEKGIDSEPTAGSENLVKSGGVVNGIKNLYESDGKNNLNISNYEYGADYPPGGWAQTNTRVTFFNNTVVAGTFIHIKTSENYRFVISFYKKAVTNSSEVTEESFIKQYEATWVTEEKVYIPAGVNSITFKVSRLDDSVIINDNIQQMFSIATTGITNKGGIIGEIKDELKTHSNEIGDLHDIIYKNITENFNLDNYTVGSDSEGSWVDINTRMTFFLGKVVGGDIVHIKSNEGYKFVIESFNDIVISKNDMTSIKFIEQVPNIFTTEAIYIVPSNTKSVTLKVAKTDQTQSIVNDDPDLMLSIATKSYNIPIDKNVDDLSNSLDLLSEQINKEPVDGVFNLTNYEIGSESLGTWVDIDTRIMFFVGDVLPGDLVHIKAAAGYRFVVIAYNALVVSKTDMSPSVYVDSIPSSWVVDETFVVASSVKSLAIKVSRDDNSDITSDDPALMIEVAKFSRQGGLESKVSAIEKDQERIDKYIDAIVGNNNIVLYSGDIVELTPKNKINYINIGETDWYYKDNNINQPAEGLAVYGKYMFKLYTLGLCKCYNIENITPKLISSFKLGSYNLNYNHANCAQFGPTIIEGDFPYLYISNSIMNEGVSPSVPPICYVEKITPEGSELIQTITLDTDYQFRWCNIICGDDGYLYAVGINCSALTNGTMRIVKYNLPNTSNSSVLLTDDDIIDYFEVTYDGTTHILQGTEIRNGKIFLPMSGAVGSGALSNNNILRVIDLNSKAIKNDILIPFDGHECEDVSVYNGIMYISYYSTTSTYRLNF